MRLHARHHRSGFTLIELLVVMSIIILLASITVVAVFRLQNSQKESNTNTHLQKLDMLLAQQYKAVMDQIRKEDPPPLIVELTKNADGTRDMSRARALHMKLRLRQEFPQNFRDLRTTPPPLNYFGQTYQYPPKASYVAAVKNPLMINPTTFAEPQPEMHSAALLVLILTQGRGGASNNPDAIARTKLMSFPQAGGAPDVQLRVFVDEWDRNIAFRRFADDDMTDILAELNQPPHVSQAAVVSGNMDPHDPDGRLRILTWPGRAIALSYLAYPNAPPLRPSLNNPFDGTNRGPYAFSACRDGNFFTQDDLLSYRLNATNRGN
jgi:prepilin-type N-terminal cleavage/methylation domain-containing protein